jgi:hypothetical protein
VGEFANVSECDTVLHFCEVGQCIRLDYSHAHLVMVSKKSEIQGRGEQVGKSESKDPLRSSSVTQAWSTTLAYLESDGLPSEWAQDWGSDWARK